MADHKVLLYSDNLSPMASQLAECFHTTLVNEPAQVSAKLGVERYCLVVLDFIESDATQLLDTISLCVDTTLMKIPVVVLAAETSLHDKLHIYDLGIADLISNADTLEEAEARCRREIYHSIAMSQLSDRLNMATETAHYAMVDNSDLGSNVQFLLALHQCDNLDQLGQQFFSSIQRYGLNCSLQMRSLMDVKNMEASGMAKDLESQLLAQLKDSGRYLDFGRRTIINYERVSLLIKNMPHNDPDKYGAIKDNVFALVQGMNARIIALEDRYKLAQEKNTMERLSYDVHSVIGLLKCSYQEVMRDIATVVENTAEKIQIRIPALALNESDEEFLDLVTSQCVEDTMQVFNEGLKVNETFETLEMSLERALNSRDSAAEEMLVSKSEDDNKGFENSMVDLF